MNLIDGIDIDVQPSRLGNLIIIQCKDYDLTKVIESDKLEIGVCAFLSELSDAIYDSQAKSDNSEFIDRNEILSEDSENKLVSHIKDWLFFKKVNSDSPVSHTYYIDLADDYNLIALTNVKTARKIYGEICNKRPDRNIFIIDLRGVKAMTTECARELFGKLFVRLNYELDNQYLYSDHIKVKNASKAVEFAISFGIDIEYRKYLNLHRVYDTGPG